MAPCRVRRRAHGSNVSMIILNRRRFFSSLIVSLNQNGVAVEERPNLNFRKQRYRNLPSQQPTGGELSPQGFANNAGPSPPLYLVDGIAEAKLSSRGNHRALPLPMNNNVKQIGKGNQQEMSPRHLQTKGILSPQTVSHQQRVQSLDASANKFNQ